MTSQLKHTENKTFYHLHLKHFLINFFFFTIESLIRCISYTSPATEGLNRQRHTKSNH
ncbi:unnamed protein product [Brassica napus]|uniref:(rape) hypothetical protein n=1 Tax=Brassica napus TaxID=3708 RepID=A0A817AX78_BRANA|nr:unnamed protein product [Brassica napus]